jgi:hypothetical protein
VVLRSLFALLVVYVGWPQLFGSGTAKGKSAEHAVSTRVRTFVAVIALIVAAYVVFRGIRPGSHETTALPERWVLAGVIENFDSGKPCGANPPIRHQLRAVIVSLEGLHPSRVQVIGIADTTSLAPLARDFAGNNAGLARMRAQCIIRWLHSTSALVGVEFSEAVDLPRDFRSADSTDRAVVVLALTRPVAR